MSEEIRGTKIHAIKCYPEFFDYIDCGSKHFEIRKNDTDYRVGDFLQIIKYCPIQEIFIGEPIHREITYMTDFEQKEGFVVLSIQKIQGMD